MNFEELISSLNLTPEKIEKINNLFPESMNMNNIGEKEFNTLSRILQLDPKKIRKSFASYMPKNTPKKSSKIGRNQPCPCGSKLKYKKCCYNSLPAPPPPSPANQVSDSDDLYSDSGIGLGTLPMTPSEQEEPCICGSEEIWKDCCGFVENTMMKI